MSVTIKKSTKIFVKPSNEEEEMYNKSAKPCYCPSIEETTIRDLKPILIVCRLFGMAPYAMSSAKISMSNIGMIYSGIILIYYISIIGMRAKVVYNEEIDLKLKVLTIARIMLLVSTTCSDAIICICWDRKFQNCLNNTWYCEKVIKFQQRKTNRFVIISWTLTTISVIFYLFMAALSYLFDNDNGLIALIYVTFYLPMTFSVLKFLLIAIVIRRRFLDLNSSLTKEISASKLLDVNIPCNFKDLWSLHDHLTSAIKDLNSLFSIQLFLWISTITFNIISRIYLFFIISTVRFFYTDLREVLFLIYFITLLASLSIVCHITAKEANKMSSIIFSPKYYRRDRKNSKEDSLNIGHYFLNHSFNFTAAFGFFAVDVQLLFSIAGAITTYLVILIGPTRFSNS